jgi:ATP-binding cassette, subfamily G (WHITE), member 2, PDR
VALDQASQSIYDIFDKVTVLWAGRQIYFGPTAGAKSYFESMGWMCPPRQTTPDFLTSVTNPSERKARPDAPKGIPRTAVEFERYWLQSEQYRACLEELADAREEAPDKLMALQEAHLAAQALHTRKSSPYLLSLWMQLQLCMRRCLQLLWNDRASTVTLALGRIFLALIIGSIYFGMPNSTASLQSRGSIIFLATLMNALMAITEIGSLFAKRGIVRKQNSFAFYHPSIDALATFLVDFPIKLVISTLFNVVYYFLSGLRYEASASFIFLLFTTVGMMVMSAIFRTVGAVSKEQPVAYAVAGVLVLMMVIYTGFTLQTSYMHPWFRWINYINPIAYLFEALLVNEVHSREIPCEKQSLVPPYGQGVSFACASIGAEAGQRTVSGDSWVSFGYLYSYSHLWRNLGVVMAYLVVFSALHLIAIELKSSGNSKPQRLVFISRKAANKPADFDMSKRSSTTNCPTHRSQT